MKISFHSVVFVLFFSLLVIRSEAAPGPILFSTETDLGSGFLVENFAVVNLEPANSGLNLLKVRFDFPVAAIVLSLPSGWNSVSFGKSIEAFSKFSGPRPFGTDVIPGESLNGFRFFVNQSTGSIPFTYTFANSQSTQITTTGTSSVSKIFSAFYAELEVSGPVKSGFELNTKFSLAATTDGINPVTEPVILQVGTFSRTIPPGSFHLNQYGSFVFETVINGVNLEMRITSLGNNSFAFKAEGTGVDLTALANPVTVAFTIGNDTGLTTVVAEHNRR